jgi:hypothetical protein
MVYYDILYSIPYFHDVLYDCILYYQTIFSYILSAMGYLIDFCRARMIG